MRPIQLSAHTRPVSKVLFNTDGDLLFTSAKDQTPMAWWAHNGERLGTYSGHSGAVMDIDIDFACERLLSCSGDGTVRIWEAETGREIQKYNPDAGKFAPVRSCAFSCGDDMFVVGTGRTNSIYVWKNKGKEQTGADGEKLDPDLVIVDAFKKQINCVIWGPTNDTIIACSDDGTVAVFDSTTGNEVHRMVVAVDDDGNPTGKALTDMAYSKDKTMIVITSHDCTARLYDVATWTLLKTYNSDKPVNTAAMHPYLNTLVIAGGQHARDVTTTGAEKGLFDVEFMHTVYQEKIGIVKTGHFSPVNSIAFSPDGRYFVTGAEEGNARIFKFDDDFEEKFKRMETHYEGQ